MFHVCLSYCTDRDQSKDILQEAFIKAFRNLRTFRSGNSFEGWLRRIVINTALDYLRKSKKWSLIVTQETAADTEDTDDTPALPYQTNQVMSLARELPPGPREVFNLYALEELRHKRSETRTVGTGG